MKHKGLFKNVLGLSMALVLGLFISSCGDDTNPPSIKLYVTVDGFSVDIAAEASDDVTSWHWDYGDGMTSDSIGSHMHTYEEGGNYTIKCSVTNADGLTSEASESVTIATIEELLTAKPWQLSNSGNNGIGFEITPELVATMPVNDILAAINSLRADDETYDFTTEYNDIYTFSADGNFEVSTNGSALCPWVYGSFSGDKIIGKCEDAGFLVITLDDVKDTQWKLHKKETLAINVVYDADQDGGPDDINNDGKIDTNDIVQVKIPDANFISFNNGGYLGVKDYGVTDGETNYEYVAIINSITGTEMSITVFTHMAVEGQGIGINEPCYLVKMTFKAIQ